MSDLLQIFLTAALTLIGGTLLFIFGELARVLVIVPLQKYKEHVEVIRDRLDFYSNRVTNFFSEEPDDEEWALIRQISSEFRSGATQLSSRYVGISLRGLLIRLKVIPTTEKLGEAYKSLIFLSNNIPRHGRRDTDSKHNPIMMNHDAIEKAKSALNP